MEDKLHSFFNIKGIDSEDIPHIPLYMDQLLGIFEEFFQDHRRSADDKIMTKTMVNNYVKAKVIDPPVKKKYSKEQIMLLMIIYQLKNTLSIGDIKTFINLYDSDEITPETKSQVVEAYFTKFEQLKIEHLHILKERYENISESDDFEAKRTFLANLLIEADLNKRLALLLLDNLENQPSESL